MFTIPQVSSDPVSPTAEQYWVLYSGGQYFFSYYTNEGTIERIELTNV